MNEFKVEIIDNKTGNTIHENTLIDAQIEKRIESSGRSNRKYNIKIKFEHKGSINKQVECHDPYTAITEALNTLNQHEKTNVKGVLVGFYVS